MKYNIEPSNCVDEEYYSYFNSLNTIKAKALSGSIQLEYFVASI
jgi:hypothetical protein